MNGITDASTFSGILRRDRAYRFRPVQMNTAGDVIQTLQDLILQPPKSGWPLDGEPGPKAALAYLSDTSDNRLGCDPRTAYWTQPLTESDFNEIYVEVESAKAPAANATDPCTNAPVASGTADFTAAQNELEQEIKWMPRTRSYMQVLASPFADGGIKGWADVSEVAATVYSTSRQPGGDTSLFWSEFSSLFLKVLGPVTGGVSSQAADVLNLGMFIAGRGADGSPGGESLSVATNQLGAQLVEQAQQAQATYVAMGNIIASDDSKLSIIGQYGECDPSSSGCRKDFSYPDEQKAALSFPPNPLLYECGGGTYEPWSRYPSPLAWTSLLQSFDPVNHVNGYQTYVLSVLQDGSDYHGTPPDTKTLQRMFDPVSKSQEASDGGLAVSPEDFMRDAPHYGWTGQGPGGDSCYFLD